LQRKVDLSTLPPPRTCLEEHIKRVNYQVGIWKRAHIAKPVISEPTDDNGWMMRIDRLEPKWCAGDILPPKLADILEKVNDNNDVRDDDSENDSDYSDDEDDVSSSDTDSDSDN
jgi:hypothetical protein